MLLDFCNDCFNQSGAKDVSWEPKHAFEPPLFYTSDQPTKPKPLLGSPSIFMYLKSPSAQYTRFHRTGIKYFPLSILYLAEGILLESIEHPYRISF